MEFNFQKSGTESGTEKINPLCLSGFKWCWEESNCRHMDFQSIALPSELQHHRLWNAKVRFFFESTNFFYKNGNKAEKGGERVERKEFLRNFASDG